eukprot:gene2624-3037_t
MCACTCGYKNCLCAGDKNHSRQGQKSSVFRERLSACDEDGDDDEDGNTSAQVTESQSFASEIDDHSEWEVSNFFSKITSDVTVAVYKPLSRIYEAICRPDICYAVTKLSQNMAKPSQSSVTSQHGKECVSTLVCFAKFHNGGSLQLTSSRLSDFKVENFLKSEFLDWTFHSMMDCNVTKVPNVQQNFLVEY